MSLLKPVDTRRLQQWIAQRFGLGFDEDKIAFLDGLLGRRVLETGMATAVYLERLDSTAAAAERRALILELTVPETYFFRHIEQLNALAHVIPPLVTRARAEARPLRILSAGCASGEEPYSLAIALREYLRERDVALEIHAIDLNADMIAKARRGVYSSWSLRETPVSLRRRWFHNQGTEFVLHDSIRAAVEFREGNLADGSTTGWMPGSFDVIFCRNVLMYFTRPQAAAVIERFSLALVPSGVLFLGHAETLRGLSDQFQLRQAHEAFYYQLAASPQLDGRRRQQVEPSAAVSNATGWMVRTAHEAPADTSWFHSVQRSVARIETLLAEPLQNADSASRTPSPAPATRTLSATAEIVQRARQMLAAEQFQPGLRLLAELPKAARRAADVQLLEAALFAQSGELDAAERVSRELLEHDACNAGAHYLVALCRENAHDLQGAVQHDRIAVALDPNFAMPRLHLGLIARRSGDGEGARRELQYALALLKTEEPVRLQLFGGGFEREALLTLCGAELRASGGKRR